MNNSFNGDRKSGKDGRDLNKFTIISRNGKRETIRRKEDRNRIFYVERYSPALFGAIVTILFLSAIDALLTLYFTSHGAYEVNPVMAYYLQIGPYSFLTVKYALTSIGVVAFLMLRNIFLSIKKATTPMLVNAYLTVKKV